MKYKTILSLFIILVFSPKISMAEDSNFSWTKNNKLVTGYKFYYKVGGEPAPPYEGVGLPEGSSPIILQDTTNYKLPNVPNASVYHFVITAYLGTNESPYSDTVTSSVKDSIRPMILSVKTIKKIE